MIDDGSHKPHAPLPPPPPTVVVTSAVAGVFNDPAASDLVLRLVPQAPFTSLPPLELHVSSAALRRCRYFDALLSDRWSAPNGKLVTLPVGVSCRRRRPFEVHATVIRLLHTLDFPAAIRLTSDALDLLPVALELLFDDLVSACLTFLEAVPWSEEDDGRVLEIIPLLSPDESRDLLARLAPPCSDDVAAADQNPSESMLHALIASAGHSHPSAACTKAFVAKLLRDYPSQECVKKVLNEAFAMIMEMVKDLVGKYASPDFRVAGDHEEREAIQRLNLQAAVTNTKHLHWLIDRMVELRVTESATVEWSEQTPLAIDLLKTLKDDAWRNVAPGLPFLITRCTFRLASSITSGSTLVSRQVRTKFVECWLPVLIVCRDVGSAIIGDHKSIYQELEAVFLEIISTLPLPEAQVLLQQCLPFASRKVDDCQHLVAAFKTWFRRANQVLQPLADGADSVAAPQVCGGLPSGGATLKL